MPDEPVTTERYSDKAKAKIAEFETVIRAILEAFKEVEKQTGEVYMPGGTYLGVKFDD